MKLNKLAFAVIAATAAPIAATAGVTVSPLLFGYHYTDEAAADQKKVLTTGKNLDAVNPAAPISETNSGVSKASDLYTGAAIGIELTPSTQFQVEYGIANADARASKESWEASQANRFDAKQATISGNLLVGTEQFTGYTNGKFKPYVLIGGGQSTLTVKNQEDYIIADGDVSQNKKTGVVKSGTEVVKVKDKIANAGLGARYLVNDALALRGEGRAIYNIDQKWWEGLALAGVEVTLGGRLTPAVPVPPRAEAPVAEEVKPVVVAPVIVEQPAPKPVPVVVTPKAPQVVDSDNDGVPDNLDACPNTPSNHVVDANGCTIQDQVAANVGYDLRVYFDRDQSTIKPQFAGEIAQVAQLMNEVPNAVATIEGHASRDSARSSAKYNQRLSEARANAVKSALVTEFGVAPNRVNAIGYGFDRPIASNDTPEGRALNRRVFADIQGTVVETVPRTTDAQ